MFSYTAQRSCVYVSVFSSLFLCVTCLLAGALSFADESNRRSCVIKFKFSFQQALCSPFFVGVRQWVCVCVCRCLCLRTYAHIQYRMVAEYTVCYIAKHNSLGDCRIFIQYAHWMLLGIRGLQFIRIFMYHAFFSNVSLSRIELTKTFHCSKGPTQGLTHSDTHTQRRKRGRRKNHITIQWKDVFC